MTGQTTQKNDLLSMAKEALATARKDYFAAVDTYVFRRSYINEQAMLAARDNMNVVKRQCEQAGVDVDRYQFGKVF